MQLNDIATTIFAGRPITRMRSEAGGVDMSVVSVRDVSTRLPPRASLEVVPVREDLDLDRLVLRENDVVVTARGSSVRSAVVGGEHDGVLPGANLFVIRLRRTSPHLLAALLRHPTVEAHLLSEFAGSSTLGFTAAALRGLTLRDVPETDALMLADMAEAVEEYALHTERAADLRRKAATEAVFGRLWLDA